MNLLHSITSRSLPLCCLSTCHHGTLTAWHPRQDVLLLQTSNCENVLPCKELRSHSLGSSPIVGPHSMLLKPCTTGRTDNRTHHLCLFPSQPTTFQLRHASLSLGLSSMCVFQFVCKFPSCLPVGHEETAGLLTFQTRLACLSLMS